MMSGSDRTPLLNGDVVLQMQPHTDWGAAITSHLFLPLQRDRCWQQLTNYPRWVEFFPDITRSDVITSSPAQHWKQIYQAACKNFFLFSARVEVYLRVLEVSEAQQQQIQFRMERGNFSDFSADLYLRDWQGGTLLTYAVRATPLLPVPSMVLEQAMRMDLPNNMRQMRRVLCSR